MKSRANIMTVILMAAAILYSTNALPCSPAPSSIIWPDNEQTDVPTNAQIVLNCGYFTNCLKDTSVELTSSGKPVEIGSAVQVGNYYYFKPKSPLSPGAKYEVTLFVNNNDYSGTTIFTAGLTADTTPPDLSGAKAKVDFKWFDNAEQVIIAGPCFGDGHDLRSDLNEYTENLVRGDAPEHYEISANIQNATDASDFVMFNIFQIDDNGVETEYAKNTYGYYSDGDLGAEMNGKKMTLRLEAVDAIGNVQSQNILIEFDFNRKDSKTTSSFDIITPLPPTTPEAEATSGCSLNATTSSGQNGGFNTMMAIICALTLNILVVRRKKAN